MSKRKGKQMNNLPHSYIEIVEDLQVENQKLREENTILKGQIEKQKCNQLIVNKGDIEHVNNIVNNTGDINL